MLIVTFHNDGTGNKEKGNYDYAVYINDRKIAEGRIENHHRPHGWERLVSRLGKEATERQFEKEVASHGM